MTHIQSTDHKWAHADQLRGADHEVNSNHVTTFKHSNQVFAPTTTMTKAAQSH